MSSIFYSFVYIKKSKHSILTLIDGTHYSPIFFRFSLVAFRSIFAPMVTFSSPMFSCFSLAASRSLTPSGGTYSSPVCSACSRDTSSMASSTPSSPRWRRDSSFPAPSPVSSSVLTTSSPSS